MVELIPEKIGPWTFEDLFGLPDDLSRRAEISDGILEVSPPPAVNHQEIAMLLATELNQLLLPDRIALTEVGVDLGRSYRVPDISVIRRSDRRRGAQLLDPEWIDLVVEIVSPDSETRDRVTKPGQYAAARIPGFWRVETEPTIAVTAFALVDGDYVVLGTWGEGEVLDLRDPFEVSIAIDDLVT